MRSQTLPEEHKTAATSPLPLETGTFTLRLKTHGQAEPESAIGERLAIVPRDTRCPEVRVGAGAAGFGGVREHHQPGDGGHLAI